MQAYVKLKRLSESTQSDLASSFHRIAEILSKTGTPRRRPLQLQFSIFIGDTEESTPWCVTVAKDGRKVAKKRIEKPDVEIIARAETWSEIAEGRLSPVEAFVQGRLRVRGNLERAKRIFLVDLAAATVDLPTWLR